MDRQSPKPGQLVIELRTWLRVAVGRVKRGHDNPIHRRLDVPALLVLRVARQIAQGLDGLPSRQDRHTVPGLLTSPDRLVSSFPDFGDRKFSVSRLEFLQADDVRTRLAHPVQKVW